MKAITVQSVFCWEFKYFQRKPAVVDLFSLGLVFSGYVATRSQKVGGGKPGAQCENFGLEVIVSNEDLFLALWHKRNLLCVLEPYP